MFNGNQSFILIIINIYDNIFKKLNFHSRYITIFLHYCSIQILISIFIKIMIITNFLIHIRF